MPLTEIAVKTYVAKLTQSGTAAPTTTILHNTLGDIVWTRYAEGQYRGTLSGAFPPDSTYITLAPIETLAGCRSDDDNFVEVLTYDNEYAPNDSWLSNACIEIRVYTNTLTNPS